MNEPDLEKVLRRYRVAEPSASLGVEIVARGTGRELGHIWGALAAAAIAAIWIASHAAMRVSESDPIRERDMAVVTAVLGGGDEARQYAEQVVPRRELAVDSRVDGEVLW